LQKNQKDIISQDDDKESKELENTTDIESEPNEDTSKKQKSLFNMAKEIEEKERQLEVERERKGIEQHEKEREDYAKKLQQDKIELIRLKQGVIDHSDTIHEVHEEASVLTFPQKISNFFYHNAWWLWIAIFLLIIATYITYGIVTTPKADATVLLFVTNDELSNYTEQMSDYFEQFVDDNTGDEVSTVNVYYIPVATDSNDVNYTSYMAKFSGEMQSANSLIVIADDSCEEILKPSEVLYKLSKDFEDIDNIDGYKYYLKDTDFAQQIGYEGTISDDMYIGIRKVQQVYDSSKKMEENFEVAYEFIERFITYQEEGEDSIG